ncbi:MAG: NAD-dependent epimerase/dehydratase family protein [Thaumarchaeota archaeon]|nr:NAD-dependent epimerase/dehydratase family protein [Nitrososphaerota archaeon]
MPAAKRTASKARLHHALVTGGVGFMGSHLTKELVRRGLEVTVLDNLSSGPRADSIRILASKGRVTLVRGDCTSSRDVSKALQGVDTVFHLAANPEVRLELNDMENCFRQNVLATHVVLQCASGTSVKDFVFSSSSTVYGEPKVLPTPEDYGPLLPISAYGASKLASEALVSSHCSSLGMNGVILRIANVVGPGSTHGVVYDLAKKLRANPHELELLGDGTQSKSYLFIDDCIDGLMAAVTRSGPGVSLYNLGGSDQVQVSEIARIVVQKSGLQNVQVKYTGGVDGGRGWMGDVKTMLLDATKITKLGWSPKLNSRQAVERMAESLFRGASVPSKRNRGQ